MTYLGSLMFLVLFSFYSWSLYNNLVTLGLLTLLNNLNSNWIFSYLYLSVLLFYFVPMLLMGSVPFNYILGASSLMMFLMSFIGWYLSYYGLNLYLIRFHSTSFLIVLGMFLFDSFVVLLRPVTLTLRIFINVSLGHFLIMMVHLSFYNWISIVWLLEMFVYLVQMYVFVTLTKSYMEIL